MKQVNFVYSRNKLDFKKFIKSTEYSDVVSYHDIITKLVKNDSDNDKPSEFVVNSYLRRKIVKSMSDVNSMSIVYALKDLDPEIITSIKELMEECWSEEIDFKLTIIEHKKLECEPEAKIAIESLPFLNNIEYTTL